MKFITGGLIERLLPSSLDTIYLFGVTSIRLGGDKLPEVSGAYLIARTWKEEGVQALFYLMGGPIYEIVNNAEDMGIRAIDFRHECSSEPY